MSGSILQTIVDDGHVKDDALSDDELKRIQQLIVGSCPKHQPGDGNGQLPFNDKRFLFDIVANGRNSIDVDKFDYLARDSYYTNVKISCDLNRLQRLTKVTLLASLDAPLWHLEASPRLSCADMTSEACIYQDSVCHIVKQSVHADIEPKLATTYWVCARNDGKSRPNALQLQCYGVWTALQLASGIV